MATACRSYSVSYFRRLVVDLLHFSAKVPSATIDRRMNLDRLVDARQKARPAVTWSAIFTKAFSLTAELHPKLRTSYMTIPWPRYYEHNCNVATLNLDRHLGGERVVVQAQLFHPDKLTLRAIDGIIEYYKNEPVDRIPSYRRALRLSKVPWPFRRLTWWAALNMFGGCRSRYFGTFGVTSVGCQGASILSVTPLLTSTLHYGMFDASGRVDMRLTFDHRVLDGAAAASSLADMEKILNGEILEECLQSAAATDTPLPGTLKLPQPDTGTTL